MHFSFMLKKKKNSALSPACFSKLEHTFETTDCVCFFPWEEGDTLLTKDDYGAPQSFTHKQGHWCVTITKGMNWGIGMKNTIDSCHTATVNEFCELPNCNLSVTRI